MFGWIKVRAEEEFRKIIRDGKFIEILKEHVDKRFKQCFNNHLSTIDSKIDGSIDKAIKERHPLQCERRSELEKRFEHLSDVRIFASRDIGHIWYALSGLGLTIGGFIDLFSHHIDTRVQAALTRVRIGERDDA